MCQAWPQGRSRFVLGVPSFRYPCVWLSSLQPSRSICSIMLLSSSIPSGLATSMGQNRSVASLPEPWKDRASASSSHVHSTGLKVRQESPQRWQRPDGFLRLSCGTSKRPSRAPRRGVGPASTDAGANATGAARRAALRRGGGPSRLSFRSFRPGPEATPCHALQLGLLLGALAISRSSAYAG